MNKLFFLKKLNLYKNFIKFQNNLYLLKNYFKFFNFKTKLKKIYLNLKYENYEFIKYNFNNYFINFIDKHKNLSIINNKYYKLLIFNNNLIKSNFEQKLINNSFFIPKNIQITNLHKNIIPSNKSFILTNTKISSKSPKEKEINLKLNKYINKYKFINNFYSLNITNSLLYTLYSNLNSPKKFYDIISGLQYIETIFEWKNKKYNSIIINNGYLINKIESYNYNNINNIFYNKLLIFNNLNNNFTYSELSNNKNYFLIEPSSIIKGGDIALYNNYSPDLILKLKFKSLSNYFNQFKSTKLSFNFIYNIIIESLYKQYSSNNINIPIIHFELLAKKMTSCVKIINSGNSYFKNEDILPLNIIHLTNISYIIHNYNKIIYSPLLLGLSKSILSCSGFLTAASFQYTIRILVKSALENQIDWLVDLKTKLILSDLIPAGSGWYRFFNKSII